MTTQEILAEVDERGLLDEPSCARFLLKICTQIRASLPRVGVEGLATAEEFWVHGSATAAELDQARLACWTQVDSRTEVIDQKQISALRALICILAPLPSDDDLLDLLSLAVQFVDEVDPSNEQAAVVAEIWGVVPNAGKPAQSSVAPDGSPSVAPEAGAPSSAPRVNAGIGQEADATDPEKDGQ